MAAKARRKHVPQRTCIVCRRILSKRELNRVVRTADGVHYDEGGKRPGRGAYLCDDADCWQKALETRSLHRALKTGISSEDMTVLEEEMKRKQRRNDPPSP